MKVRSLRSWNTNADNLDDMVAFYQNSLGATIERTHTVGGVNVARLKLGNTTVGLFDASQGPRPGVPHHTFEIEEGEDSATVVKELESNGVTVDGIRQHGDGPGYSVYVNDPSGNRLELSWDPA